MIGTNWALQLICIRPCRCLIIPFSNIIMLLSLQLQHHTQASGNAIYIAFETESADTPCTPVRMYIDENRGRSLSVCSNLCPDVGWRVRGSSIARRLQSIFIALTVKLLNYFIKRTLLHALYTSAYQKRSVSHYMHMPFCLRNGRKGCHFWSIWFPKRVLLFSMMDCSMHP
jgi:hypothetical protein